MPDTFILLFVMNQIRQSGHLLFVFDQKLGRGHCLRRFDRPGKGEREARANSNEQEVRATGNKLARSAKYHASFARALVPRKKEREV